MCLNEVEWSVMWPAVLCSHFSVNKNQLMNGSDYMVNLRINFSASYNIIKLVRDLCWMQSQWTFKVECTCTAQCAWAKSEMSARKYNIPMKKPLYIAVKLLLYTLLPWGNYQIEFCLHTKCVGVHNSVLGLKSPNYIDCKTESQQTISIQRSTNFSQLPLNARKRLSDESATMWIFWAPNGFAAAWFGDMTFIWPCVLPSINSSIFLSICPFAPICRHQSLLSLFMPQWLSLSPVVLSPQY